jgi:hypothetical protein
MAPKPLSPSASDLAAWARRRDTLKTQWVVAVLAFWITVAITALVFWLKGELHFILLSVALGTLALGLWLKTRFQLHLRQRPRDPGP